MPRTSRKPKQQRRGFTLLELMVVIVIIGLISGITTVAVMDALKNARIETTRQTILGCEGGLQLYAMRHGRYPDTAQGLAILHAERMLDKRKPLVDAWGHALAYIGAKDHYTITSYGDDGEPGGEDAAADIVVEGGR